MIPILSCFLGASALANIGLIVFLLKRKPLGKAQYTYDATALLRDLTSGVALVKVEYLDRADILLRSPRHM